MLVGLGASGCFEASPTPIEPGDGGSGSSGMASTGADAGEAGDAMGDGTGGCNNMGCEPRCDGDQRILCVEDDLGCPMEVVEDCPLGCASDGCIEPGCGDGMRGEGEACDDGNDADADGCSAACVLEDGWSCDDGEPTVCTAPDLAVRIVSAAFTLSGLQVSYAVSNAGGVASGPYRVDLWDTRSGGFGNPPSPGMSGPFARADHPSLMPGATVIHAETLLQPPQGAHIAWAVIDTNDEVVEVVEVDNVAQGHAWTSTQGVVFTTIGASNLPVEIPDDGGAARASVEIEPGFEVVNPELTFSITLLHPAVDELQLRVVAPGGASRILASALAPGENLVNTSFRAGGTALSSAEAPYTGVFDFEHDWVGTPELTGTWSLEVTDAATGNVGEVRAFSMTVRSQG